MKMTMTQGLFAALLGLIGASQAKAAGIPSAPPTGFCALSPTFGGPAGGGPGPNQAFLWTNTFPPASGSTCYVLNMDASGDPWTSWDASTAFPNDVIQAVAVGTSVNLVLFWNGFNTKDNGQPLNLTSGQFAPSLGSWNRQASAARLQRYLPGNCGGTAGRLVIWADPSFSGDCTEFPLTGQASCYSTPIFMGFRNDTVSSTANTSSITSGALWVDINFHAGMFTVASNEWNSSMSHSGVGFNDITSSVGISSICLR